MAKRKQKRRRAKERRHEYEYVYVDDEGQEVEVDEPDLPAKNGKSRAKPSTSKAVVAGGRKVEPPTWRRTLRRAALFAPLMAVVVYLLQGGQRNVGIALWQTVVLMALFIPFSYFMDSVMYRSAQKRAARGKAPAKSDSGR